MNINDLQEMIAKDFPWDEGQLEGENSKTTKLWIKYIKLWSDENLKIEILENRLGQLIQQKRNYYGGNGTPEEYKAKPFNLKLRSDAAINKYVEGDDDVIKAKEKILIQKQKVVVLSACLDEVKRRSFSLKNALDYYRFINGG